MNYSASIVARTPVEVFSVEDAKRELDVTFDDDNALIKQQIDTAVSWIEQHCNLFLFPATIDLFVDGLPTPLRLPYGPVRSVTSINVAGSVVSGFRAIGGSPYAILPPAGSLWPFTATEIGAGVVRFEAGYLPGTVPDGIVGAIRAILAIYYDKPTGAELTAQWNAVKDILTPYRVRSI